MTHKTRLKFLIITTLVLFVGSYAAWQLRDIVGGPKLTINSPLDKSLATEQLITITGQAVEIDWLFLNDRQIFTDEAGKFEEKALALPGYNVIQLTGKDKFGRTTTKVIEFVYNNQQQTI